LLRKVAEREDRGNRWVLAAFGVIGLAQAYLPAYADRVGFWTLDGDSQRWFGVVVYAGGGIRRIWPVFVLGRRLLGGARVFYSGVGILLTAVTPVPRIASEETLLQCQFGTEYDAYRARTRRLVPFVADQIGGRAS
jgi:protein-S-isoprenylcysteine O-methyltransferase Ste14